MTSSLELYPDDGLKVLKLLKEVTKTTLPEYGLLAGQAVCSALLYLKGQDSQININDLDIFIPIHTEEDNLYAFKPHHAIPRAHAFYSSVDRIDKNDVARQAWRNQYYKALEKEAGKKVYKYQIDRSEYEEIEKAAYTLFPERKENFLRFEESTFKLGYKIISVFRRGLKNIIFTKKPRSIVLDSKSLFSFDVEAMKILSGFDINCVQVGIDLKTGKLFYTPEFVGFLHSKQLRILQCYRPWHTIIRYYQKKDIHGYFGNDELAIALTSTFHDLRTPNLMEDLLDLEPPHWLNERSFYGHKGVGTENNIPRFGQGYIDKYKSVRNLLQNHFNLRVDTLNINKKTDDKYQEKAKALPDTTRLGSLQTRYSGVGSILGGSHRRSLEKQFGLKIINYPAYARNNIVPIIEDKFGLYGKKLHERRSRLLDGLGKPNTRKNPYFKGPFLEIASGRLDKLSGNLYQEGLEKVRKLLKTHHELRGRFSTLSLEDQISAMKRINWLEKNYPYLAFHILTGNVAISNHELLTLPKENLVTQINEHYEAWKKEQLRKPALVKTVFEEVQIPDTDIFAVELTRNSLLLEEGTIQKHCVGGYGRRVKNGNCRIVSFRKNFRDRVTAELIWVEREQSWVVTQFKARFNRAGSIEFYQALSAWKDIMKEKNIKINHRDWL